MQATWQQRLQQPRNRIALAAAAAVVVVLVGAFLRYLTSVGLTGLVRGIVVGWLGLPESWVDPIVMALACLLILVLVILPAVMWPMIWGLRKILAFFQVRLGPMRVGRWGWLQTVADALKLLTKEDTYPAGADRRVFALAPIMVFVPALMVYVVVPFSRGPSWIARDLNAGVLYISAITSIAVIGVIAAGWASNSKYSLLGALRSAAQLVSYEVPLILAVMGPVVLAGTLSLQGIVNSQDGGFWNWYVFGPQLLGFLLFATASLAETSQTPFDLPEAESEIVAGYHIEYSGMRFGMFFLAEFANVFTIAAVAATLFLGGWQAPLPFLPDGGFAGVFWFMIKTLALVFLFMWIRATLPRVRIDQLMGFAWKGMIPLALLNLMVAGIVAVAF